MAYLYYNPHVLKLVSNYLELAPYLTAGHAVVAPTDTIYGVLAAANNPQAVDDLFSLRRRNPMKPFITLVSSVDDIEELGIPLSRNIRELLLQLWPAPTSVVIPSLEPHLAYLRKEADGLAFRLPDSPELIELIRQTGPLQAPSANFEGHPPAATVSDAQAYFGDLVAAYYDLGARQGKPSRIIKLHLDGTSTVLRD